MKRIKLSSFLSKGKLSFDLLWTELSGGVSIDFECYGIGYKDDYTSSGDWDDDSGFSGSIKTFPGMTEEDSRLLDDIVVTARYNTDIFSEYKLDQFKDVLYQTEILDKICSAIEISQEEKSKARYLRYLGVETDILRLSPMKDLNGIRTLYRFLIINFFKDLTAIVSEMKSEPIDISVDTPVIAAQRTKEFVALHFVLDKVGIITKNSKVGLCRFLISSYKLEQKHKNPLQYLKKFDVDFENTREFIDAVESYKSFSEKLKKLSESIT